MDFGIYAGDTNKTIYLRLRDSTTGLAKTGLVFNSAGAVASYTLPLAARAAITLATQTVTGAHSDGGFVEVDATNCKGLYRLDLPDAAIASGDYSIISIEFDGTIEESILVPLHVRHVNVIEWLGSAADALATQTDIGDEVDTRMQGINLDHLMKTAVANNADMTAEVVDGTVLSNILSATSDTSTYTVATDSLEANANTLGVAGAGLTDLGGMSSGMQAEVKTQVDSSLDTAIPGTPTTGSDKVVVINSKDYRDNVYPVPTLIKSEPE